MTAKTLLNSITVLAMGMAASALTGCQQDGLYDEGHFYTGDPMMEFRGTVTDEEPVTRALTQTPVNVEPNEFDGYFYIQVNDPTYKPDPDGPEENSSKFGYYEVPPTGNGGVLSYADTEHPELKPNWFTADDDHYFWSWTLPWTEAAAKDGLQVEYWGPDVDDNGIVQGYTRAGDDDGDGDGDDDDDGDGDDTNPEPETPVYDPVDPSLYLNTKPIRIKLRNTYCNEFTYYKDDERKDSIWDPRSWGNGYFFEKFVGAKSGPYDFRNNGVEVPLQFRHLMSKISLRSLIFYRANGAVDEDLKANLTFINMPTEFTFYPHPTEQDVQANPTNKYIKADGPPIVVTNFDSAKPNDGITFAFTNPIDLLPEEDPDNKVQYRDKFYICPEVDFSKVSFRIDFPVEKPGDSPMNRGEYYGDFASVAFDRDPALGPDYDNTGDPDSPDYVDDSKVLHAGETMYFDLLVREYGGGGYTIYVRGWDTRPQQQTKHYPHPGIYVDGEAVELVGTTQTAQTKFDLYGDGFWDGDRDDPTPSLPDHMGMFYLYGDVKMGNRTAFPLDKEYVFNGNGYIVSFQPSNGETTTLTIGKMVDVYLEMNGKSVYIDPDGWIYTQDPRTGKYEPTNNQLDVHADKASFTLDLATGTIK